MTKISYLKYERQNPNANVKLELSIFQVNGFKNEHG
jgi:hypothetical protein